MMKAPANVTMIAGRRSTATIAPVRPPTEQAYRGDCEETAGHAERPSHRRCRNHRSEADGRTDGQTDPAGQHQHGLGHRDERKREPVLGELRESADREKAGKQEGVENEESGDDDEQPAHIVVAPELHRQIEGKAAAARCSHQAAA